MLCPANVLGVILAIRHRLNGIFAFAVASVAAASLFRRAPLLLREAPRETEGSRVDG